MLQLIERLRAPLREHARSRLHRPDLWEVAVMLGAGLPPLTGEPEADAELVEYYYRYSLDH